MEISDAKNMATLLPTEHLQNATALIKRIFKKELKNKLTHLKIYYKKK